MHYLEFLKTIGLKPGILIAGFFGSVAHVLYRGEKSFTKGFALVTSGVFTTAYTTPLVVHKFNLTEDTSYAAAFVIGILGMYIVGAIIMIGENLKRDPFGTLHKLLTAFKSNTPK